MEAAISAVLGVLPGVASTAVLAVCGFAYKKLKGFRGEHSELVNHLQEYEASRDEAKDLREMQKAQNFALREILGDMLDKEYCRLAQQGYASPDEKLKYERKYKAYHGLGGNGTRTAHYEDALAMSSYPN